MSSSFRRGTRIRGLRAPKVDIAPGALASRAAYTTSNAVFERTGTKPWVGGLTLTSSGLRELDAILGGGQPLETAMLIEEDRWTQDLAMALVRYWCAEAVAQEQTLSLVATMKNVDNIDTDIVDSEPMQFQEGMSRRGLETFLHMLPRDKHLDKTRAKSDAMVKKIESALTEETVSSLQGFGTIEEGEDFDEEEPETNETGGDEGLTNAWQYKVSIQRERLGTPMSSKASKSTKTYCHSYDLSGKMEDQHDANWLERNDHIVILENPCTVQNHSYAIDLYRNCVRHIHDSLAKYPSTVVRLVLMNAPVETTAISLPLLLSYVRENELPVVFLITVRPWLRPANRQSSFHTSSYTQSLISLRRSCDAVFNCEGFTAVVTPPPPEFSDLAGILNIRKIALQSLAHFSDTITNRRPPANRYGMKRDRRKMHIRMLHLPPEHFSAGGSSVGSGVRSGAGKPKESNDSKNRTALQPGMGCATNKRTAASSTGPLDF